MKDLKLKKKFDYLLLVVAMTCKPVSQVDFDSILERPWPPSSHQTSTTATCPQILYKNYNIRLKL